MENLDAYLEKPYTLILRKDEEGDFVARVTELEGCSAHGKTPQEALENLEEAKALWISDCIESGQPVPEPSPEEPLPSGKWLQRVPKTLHRALSQLAKQEGTSLNQLVTSILAESVGARRARASSRTDEAALPDRVWIGEREGTPYWVVSEGATPTLDVYEALRLLYTRPGRAPSMRRKTVEHIDEKWEAGSLRQ